MTINITDRELEIVLYSLRAELDASHRQNDNRTAMEIKQLIDSIHKQVLAT